MSGYELPKLKDLKPGNFQWPDFTKGWTKGAVDKMNSWVGRSRPLTGGGATANVGATDFPGTGPSNVNADGYQQPNYGGTFMDRTSMVGVSDWMAPHTEPQNNVVVDQTAHAPNSPDFNQKFSPNRVFR